MNSRNQIPYKKNQHKLYWNCTQWAKSPKNNLKECVLLFRHLKYSAILF